jgi:hypothetical protein
MVKATVPELFVGEVPQTAVYPDGTVIVWPLLIVTVSPETGTIPLGHGAFGVVLSQFPVPAEVIAATDYPCGTKSG